MELQPGEGEVSDTDRAAVVAAASDYVASWYDSDPERMRDCLHPALVKRAVEADGSLDDMTRDDMVNATSARERAGEYEITLLDAYGDIATAKVLSTHYVDYVQVVRTGERWQLLNVLWQPRNGA